MQTLRQEYRPFFHDNFRGFRLRGLSKTATRIFHIESKTKNISIDASGNTVFENEIKTFGEVQAYDFILIKKS